MNQIEECLICGDETPICPCYHGLPVCEFCAVTELPRIIAHAVLTERDAGCAMGRLHAALTSVEKSYWEAAAYHLHAYTEAQHDGCNDPGHEGPTSPIFQPSMN